MEEGRLLEADESCRRLLKPAPRGSQALHIWWAEGTPTSARACVCPDACDLGLREQVYSLRFSHALALGSSLTFPEIRSTGE